MPKMYTVNTPDAETESAIRSGISNLARALGYDAVHKFLTDLVTEKLSVVPASDAAIVGYIQLTRRVATSDHECSECGNEIGNLDLYLQVYANGKTGAVVCSDCATE